ncbi:neuronal acetylcholine receptor subunit alpha-7 [Elysia marginata]|uniref:Neuronal acetylcholine receptor subunit alpha-7 n=1 Tax=Elysia marginata TaxID=1093978 RepID=A0AAV4IHP1_9GAST|nr:neuronal acetylcholine receptor subunit alpha-7 [Elysia marginata]
MYINRPTTELTLTEWAVAFSSSVRTNGEWEQVGISNSLRPQNFGQTFDTLYIEVSFKRLSRYYLINVIAPMLLLSCLCNVVFLVSAESGDKLSVALTLLLSESVFLSYTSSLMPRTSDELPLLTLFLLCLLVVNTMSILATMFVLKTFKRSKSGSLQPPQLLVTVMNLFGPHPEPDNHIASRTGSDERTLRKKGDISLPVDPENLATRRGGLLRTLPQKLAHVATLGWFVEKGAKYPTKISPGCVVNGKEGVAKSVWVKPTYTTGSSLGLEEPSWNKRTESIPVYGIPLPASTVVSFPTEDGCDALSDLYSENILDEETFCHGQVSKTHEKFEPSKNSRVKNSTEAANPDYQCLNKLACADNLSPRHTFTSKTGNTPCGLAWQYPPAPNADMPQYMLGKGSGSEIPSSSDYAQEWLFISRALDRMFFLLFNFLIGGVTVFFFAKVL